MSTDHRTVSVELDVPSVELAQDVSRQERLELHRRRMDEVRSTFAPFLDELRSIDPQISIVSHPLASAVIIKGTGEAIDYLNAHRPNVVKDIKLVDEGSNGHIPEKEGDEESEIA